MKQPPQYLFAEKVYERGKNEKKERREEGENLQFFVVFGSKDESINYFFFCNENFKKTTGSCSTIGGSGKSPVTEDTCGLLTRKVLGSKKPILRSGQHLKSREPPPRVKGSLFSSLEWAIIPKDRECIIPGMVHAQQMYQRMVANLCNIKQIIYPLHKRVVRIQHNYV